VAVGQGRWDEDGEKRVPMDVAVGDIVIYKEWGKTSIKIEGEEFFIMSQNDILAVVAN
jgi:chaperonin GroES